MEDFAALARQAVQAQHQGKVSEAARLYLKALAVRPRWTDGWRNAGMLFADLKDYSRAKEAFRKLVEIEPKSGTGWALLGLTEYELRLYDDAYQHIQRGRSLGVGNRDLETLAAYHAALIMIQKGEFEIAHHHLVEVARYNADDPELVTAFGLASLRLAENPENVNPQQKDLVTWVGRIELQATHAPVPEVVAAYEQLIQEFPRAQGLHYAFGNFAIDVGHYEQGLDEMRKELELNPNDAMALLQVAMTSSRATSPPKRCLTRRRPFTWLRTCLLLTMCLAGRGTSSA